MGSRGTVIEPTDTPYYWKDPGQKEHHLILCRGCRTTCHKDKERWIGWKLPAKTITAWGSTLTLAAGCNIQRACLLKTIAREYKRKTPVFTPAQQGLNFVQDIRVGSHSEWVETTPKHGYHRIVEEYTTKFHDCLPGKEWLKDHYKDEYPEATIELAIDGKTLSVNGDYKKGMIREFMKPYTTKIRVGRKSATLNIGEADRVIKQDLPADITNERREKKVKPKPNNHKRREILDFARDHGLVIHPGGGYEYYIDIFYKSGHCPCDKTRLSCPCPESIEEVASDGWCKCHLFWRDLDTYKESHVKVY